MSSRFRSPLLFAAGVTSAVVAVSSLTVSGFAAPGPDESTFVPVTPIRVLDTRDPVDLGLAGPFTSAVSQDLRLIGEIPTAVGPRTVVPDGASGVVLNVTVVNASADGFVSIRPADATGAPSTSNLNFEAGDTVPNAVTVSLPGSGPDQGTIEITYDAYGQAGPTTDVLVDLVGYTTRDGIGAIVARLDAADAKVAELEAALAAKADTAAVQAYVDGTRALAGAVNANGTRIGTGLFTPSRTGTGSYSLVFDVSRLSMVGAPNVFVTPTCDGYTAKAQTVNTAGANRTVSVQLRNGAGALTDCAFFVQIKGSDPATLPVLSNG